jgi:hypothetical protein
METPDNLEVNRRPVAAEMPLTGGVGKDFFRGIFTQAINAFSTTQRAYSNVIACHIGSVG